MKFLISIVALNRLEFTKRCIEAVMKSKNQDFELILTDNGSTDGTGEYFRELSQDHRVTYCLMDENTGFSLPNNNAFEIAKKIGARYFIALNNDTVPPPHWLDELAFPLDEDPLGVISGPAGGCASLHPNMHGHSGGKLEYIEGACMCVKVEIAAKFGPLFSSYLDFMYGEDSDLSLRMREKGYRIHQVNFRLPHSRGETSRAAPPELKVRIERAQAHNHAVLRKRWAHYLKIRTFRYPIVVQRSYALGDVLLTTPILKAIKKANPQSNIYVQTNTPEILSGNPYIKSAAVRVNELTNELRVNLDGAYEKRPGMHIVDAYAEETREIVTGLGDVERRTEMFVHAGAARFVERWNRPKLCLIHAGPTNWPGKNWPFDRFALLCTALVNQGWHVAAVGAGRKPEIIRDAADLTGKTTIPQLAALMSKAKLFIGIDSFPMHVARAVGTPTIGLFGVTSSRYILTEGSPCIGLDADPSIPCAGSRHRSTGETFVNCSPDCINSIYVDQVLNAVKELTT